MQEPQHLLPQAIPHLGLQVPDLLIAGPDTGGEGLAEHAHDHQAERVGAAQHTMRLGEQVLHVTLRGAGQAHAVDDPLPEAAVVHG